jgi:hypothetical protein
MIIEITKNGKSRIIGTLEERTFTKKVRAGAHLFRKLDAWGCDEQIFRETLAGQCDTIRIEDVESGITYTTTFETYKKFGRYKNFPPHGLQIFLPRCYFEWEEDGRVIREAPAAVKKHEKEIQVKKTQTSLF